MVRKIVLGCAALLITVMGFAPAFAHADTPATNLIANPGVETSTTGTTPDSWQSSDYVVNTGDSNGATFTYLNTGHTGNHSVSVTVANYKSGDDTWYYGDVPVTAGTTYQFSDWYQSTVDTEIDAEVMVSGVMQYYKVASVFANSAWTQFSTTFTAPAGATQMSIYHLIAATGTLTTDDYSLSAYNPTPFNRAIVSVTFDDGWLNQYQNAAPALKADGLVATYYIISNEMTNPDEAGYMTSAQVLDLYNQGNEIGSHTVHHCDLTGLQTDNPTNCPTPITAAQVDSELKDSQTTLQTLINAPVTDFAYPYGAYNAATIADAQQYYQSQRTVNAGFNSKDSLNVTELKMYEVDANITAAQVEAWIAQALAEKTWLILCYHEVAATPSDPSDAAYTTQPGDFTTEMSYLKTSGAAVETVSQALAEVKAQTGTTAAPIISNVASSKVTASGATIGWTTDQASTTQVNYGLTNTYGSSTTLDSTLATTHSAALASLTANTPYHYQVVSTNATGQTTTSADMTFTTGKPGDANGDSKINAADLSILSSHWNTLTGATLATGDFNGDGKVNAADLSILASNWGK